MSNFSTLKYYLLKVGSLENYDLKLSPFTQVESYLRSCLRAFYDAQDRSESFYLLYYQYSMHRNLLPISVGLNIFFSTLEIPSAKFVNFSLLAAL